MDITNAAGNYRLGVYDDNSNPNNLYAETGSLVVATGYTFKPVAEFALTTTGVWIAHIQNATSSQHYKSGFATGATKYKTNTYSNGLPNPVGGGFTNETYKFVQKVGHS